MEKQLLKPLLLRQLKKLELSYSDMPKDLITWREFLEKIEKTYNEYDEARISSDNVLAVSLSEMVRMQEEREKLDAGKLQQLNANLSLILHASGLGVWDWNLKTNQVNYDDRWCEILGFKANELEHVLQTFQDLTHPQDIERVLTSASNYIEKKAPKFDIKFQMLHKNGHWVYIHAKGKIISFDDDGLPLRFMGTHNDLSEEVRIQNEVEVQKHKLFHQSKLASLGEMSAGIAHEVNNPLAIISGSAEQLTKYKDNPDKFNSKIGSILKSCERISKILEGLRKFSRSAENNKMSVLDLSLIIDEVIILTQIKASRELTQISREYSGDLRILCDELSIEQVLINLLNNGIDAIKKNDERWVKITAYREGQEVILRVIDSGLMISTELESKIFDPFFTTKKVGEGTGLGLSISKGILDEHHATISLNRKFTNTCFEIRFPSSGEKNVN
ncbi:MAG: PAS domain-containing protein [Bacteriovoracaceae bacterium]